MLHISETVLTKLSPASIYLAAMTGIYIMTAILHPSEVVNLFHGIWYFLCLPTGSLLLIIYSVANLTDRTWGEYFIIYFTWGEHLLMFIGKKVGINYSRQKC